MFFLLITLIFLLSCHLFYLFLGTVGDRVLTAPSLNASLILRKTLSFDYSGWQHYHFGGVDIGRWYGY